MTTKAEITQAQADAIIRINREFSPYVEDIIRDQAHGHNGWANKLTGLRGMPLLLLIDALRVGYVVKPKFAVGDIVQQLNGSVFKTESYHGEVILYNDKQVFIKDLGWFNIGQLMNTTPEEVATEKTRMMWLAVEPGDVLIQKQNKRLCTFISHHSLDKIMTSVSWYNDKLDLEPRDNFELYAKKLVTPND